MTNVIPICILNGCDFSDPPQIVNGFASHFNRLFVRDSTYVTTSESDLTIKLYLKLNIINPGRQL